MKSNIDLGLAVSALSLKPGETRTQREIAAFCDCSYQRIQQIEWRALRKIRRHFMREKNADVREALLALIRKEP